MKLLKSFGRFWYDFIVGDDWKIAVAVVLALALLLAALSIGLLADAGLAVLGGVLLMAAFTVSLLIDVRPRSA
ncbi:hypothetical protein ACWDSD_21700 [Streptomyces spiralis]